MFTYDHDEKCLDRAMSYALPKQECEGCSASYMKRRRDALTFVKECGPTELQFVEQIMAARKNPTRE